MGSHNRNDSKRTSGFMIRAFDDSPSKRPIEIGLETAVNDIGDFLEAGEVDRAHAVHRHALEQIDQAEQSGDLSESKAMLFRGAVAGALADDTAAEFEKFALDSALNAEDACRALNNLGVTAEESGRPDKARFYLEHARSICPGTGLVEANLVLVAGLQSDVRLQNELARIEPFSFAAWRIFATGVVGEPRLRVLFDQSQALREFVLAPVWTFPGVERYAASCLWREGPKRLNAGQFEVRYGTPHRAALAWVRDFVIGNYRPQTADHCRSFELLKAAIQQEGKSSCLPPGVRSFIEFAARYVKQSLRQPDHVESFMGSATKHCPSSSTTRASLAQSVTPAMASTGKAPGQVHQAIAELKVILEQSSSAAEIPTTELWSVYEKYPVPELKAILDRQGEYDVPAAVNQSTQRTRRRNGLTKLRKIASTMTVAIAGLLVATDPSYAAHLPGLFVSPVTEQHITHSDLPTVEKPERLGYGIKGH